MSRLYFFLQQHSTLFANTVLALLAFCAFIVNSIFLYHAPLLAGSDILHHNWITNQIVLHGTVPTVNPFFGGFDILYFSPLFQVLGAMLHFVTGLETVYVYIGLHAFLPVLYIVSLFLLTKKLWGDVLPALFACSIFFLYSTNGYIAKLNILLDIKQANLVNVLFLIILLMLMLFYEKKHRIGQYAVLLALWFFALPLYHQLSTFAALVVISSFLVVAFFLYPRERKRTAWVLGVLVIGLLGVLLINVQQLFVSNGGFVSGFQNTFMQESTQGMTTGSSHLSASYIENLFTNVYHPFVLASLLVGLGAWIRMMRQDKKISVPFLLLFAWLISFWFLSFQGLRGYSFMPDRFLHLSMFPVSIIAGYGLFRTVMVLRGTLMRSMIVAVTLTIVVMSFTLNMLNYSDKENVSLRELQSYLWLKHFVGGTATPIVVADPFFGSRLIALSNIRLPYQYERTNLYRADSLTFDVVKKFFYGTPDEAYTYAQKSGAAYVAISGDDTMSYYPDADYAKLRNTSRYKPVYRVDQGTREEFSVYRVVPPQEAKASPLPRHQ